MDESNYIDRQLLDHENRLRRLEESDIQQRIELSNISKSQSEIKLMMSEQSKEQMKQSREQQDMFNKFTVQMLGYFKEKEDKEIEVEKEDKKVRNEIKFYNTKQFWAVFMLILGGVLGYFGLK